MKKKIGIIVVISIVLIAIAVGAIIALLHSESQDYVYLISQSERYLNNGNYDEAILTLKKAVEQEPEKADAYIALSRAYRMQGAADLASDILLIGFNRTENVTIGRLLIDLSPEYFNLVYPDGKEDIGPYVHVIGEEPEKDAITPVLYSEALRFFSSASYNDYRQKYGGVECHTVGGVCNATANGLLATMRFFDTPNTQVINTSDGKPYSEMIPNEILMDDISVLFGGATVVTYEDLRTMSEVSNLKLNGTEVSFTACGCDIWIACDEDGTFFAGADHLIVPTGTVVHGNTIVVSGRVIDAATGDYITGAHLKFYETSYAYGTPVEAVTDSFGAYRVMLENSGNHYVEVSREGYIDESFAIYVTDSNETKKDFPISSRLKEDQIRLVLTWGAYPTDLDSYLVGTTANGKSVNISFTHMTELGADGKPLAQLDVDDMTGYGPETITLNAVEGKYEYYVIDYTGSSRMSASGAQVKIYKGDSLVEVIDICDGVENGWNVCTIENGVITVENRPR